ncbi:4-hydroxy-tetrahydrodipicolinate synthase [Legionella sp. W05-934-2]|uniref:4-hydroxy-tetrahydrodipicolinate synthase n=1 Tax=Legionella sp. W05-934-2 TaxID=1198649 RepID=UPI0034637D0C
MFRGSMVALVTPLLNGQIDVPRLKELIDYHIEMGTHALVVAGTTGESGTLNHEEKLLIIKTAVQHTRERVPVIAGTGANATRDAVAFTKEAMGLGVHAALIMTPAYIKPTQEGLFQHYSQIASQAALPIIMYNVPGRTACDLLPETIARLTQYPNIIGIKDATADMSRLKAILKETNNTLDVYSGDDPTCAEWLTNGAKGVISVTANVAPKIMAKLCELAEDKEYDACLALQSDIQFLHQLMFVEANPIPVKWMVSKQGLINDEIRLPLTPLSTKYHPAVEAAIQQLANL